ncbi:hypothetical protein JW905_12860 [bacterium]|nr:hypothetical protein [candidate division CSSED10-310 bacterium]
MVRAGWCLLSFHLVLICGSCCVLGRTTEPSDLRLSNELLTIIIDSTDGSISSLVVATDGEPLEFLLPAEQSRSLRFGSAALAWRIDGESEWNRLVTLETETEIATEANAITVIHRKAALPIGITCTYSLDPVGFLTWSLILTNTSGKDMEIGEVSVPAPFNNNYYSDFEQDDAGMKQLFHSRFYVHRQIGGATSYLLVRKLDGTFPGLLVVPAAGSSLEFFHMNLVGWEGIPQLYFHSKAAEPILARNESWLNGTTSLRLKNGESHRFELHGWPITGSHHYYGYEDMFDRTLEQILLREGKPSFQFFPGMVIPTDTTASLLVKAPSPITAITAAPEVPLDTSRGTPQFRLVQFQPDTPGPLTIETETQAGAARVHYRVVAPIAALIKRRAAFIAQHQVYHAPGHILDNAVLVHDNLADAPLVAPSTYWGGGGYEGGITDAVFLAAKNAIWPDKQEIDVLETYTDEFLLNHLQNPGNHRVAWFFTGATPTKTGRPYNYCHAINFHYWMYRIGRNFDMLRRHEAAAYLESAYKTAIAMFDYSWRWHLYNVGLMHYSIVYDLIEALRSEGRIEQAERLEGLARDRARRLLSSEYPYSAEPLFDTTGYEDVYMCGRLLADDDHMERTARCAMAQKSYAPTWFWCGSDKRYWDAMEDNPRKEYYGTDNGETCMHYTATQTALVGLTHYDNSRFFPEKTMFYKSYAALLGVWSLVHDDGSASMCYTPDMTSNHYGFNRYSGDVGLCLYGYLRAARSYMDVARLGPGTSLEQAFGAVITESDETHYRLRVTDGVGRRFSDPNHGLHVRLNCGILESVNAARDLTALTLVIANPAPVDIQVQIEVEGLWGEAFLLSGDGAPRMVHDPGEAVTATVHIAPEASSSITFTSTLER